MLNIAQEKCCVGAEAETRYYARLPFPLLFPFYITNVRLCSAIGVAFDIVNGGLAEMFKSILGEHCSRSTSRARRSISFSRRPCVRRSPITSKIIWRAGDLVAHGALERVAEKTVEGKRPPTEELNARLHHKRES
jgi:hypothetical protein